MFTFYSMAASYSYLLFIKLHGIIFQYLHIGLTPFTGTQDLNYLLAIDIYIVYNGSLRMCHTRLYTKCLYGKTTCTVKEGLYFTRSKTILNLIHSY